MRLALTIPEGGSVPAGPSVADAVAAFRADLVARGRKPESAARMAALLLAGAKWSGWAVVGDIDDAGAVAWMGHQRQTTWTQPTTLNQAVSVFKSFGTFLRRAKYLRTNPLEDLQPVRGDGEPGSRAESVEAMTRFLAAAATKHLRDRRSKGCSPLAFYFMLTTGLRVGALCKFARMADGTRKRVGIRWRDLDLEGQTYTTDPSWAKGGRRETRPLYPPLVLMLRDWRAVSGAGPDALVFPIMPNRKSFRLIRAAAKIPERDGRGRKFTVHGLRKSFATWLDAIGCPAGVRSALLCHADTLAEQKYTDHGLEIQREWLGKLPNPWPVGLVILPKISTGEKGNEPDLTSGVECAQNVTVTMGNHTNTTQQPKRGTNSRPIVTDTAGECLALDAVCSPSASPTGANKDFQWALRDPSKAGSTALEAAVMALAEFVRSQSGSRPELGRDTRNAG